MRVHVLHENPAWLGPFADALDAAGVPWEEWDLDGGAVDLAAPPPEGVFYSRMSASAHTRGHHRAAAHAKTVLAWLEAHGRRVVNGSRVLDLELSKVDQAFALRAAGIPVPRTLAVVGDDALVKAASELPAPFVVKPNRGGTGWGVRRFDGHDELEAALADGDLAAPVDGVMLVQEHVAAPAPRITRAELVAGRLLYAVDVDTSTGYELCPADACRAPGDEAGSLFSLRPDPDPGLVARYEAFARAEGVDVCAFEYIEASDGRLLTYDLNTNTNYNPDIERVAPRSGAREVVLFLAELLEAERKRAA